MEGPEHPGSNVRFMAPTGEPGPRIIPEGMVIDGREQQGSAGGEVEDRLNYIKQQQALQRELLHQHFRQQEEQLARQHQAELQQHLHLQKNCYGLGLKLELLRQHFRQQEEDLARQHQSELQTQLHLQKVAVISRRPENMSPMGMRLQALREQQELAQARGKLQEKQSERQKQLLVGKKKENSAMASTEVKEKLQTFILSKKQREAAANSLHQSPSLSMAHWPHGSLGHMPMSGDLAAAAAYKGHPMLGTYGSNADFPLRKTASEPNLKVRSRLKQKVAERRSSPLLRRRDGIGGSFKTRKPLSSEHPTVPYNVHALVDLSPTGVDTSSCKSAPGSGPSSPRSSHSNMVIAGNHEESGVQPAVVPGRMVGGNAADFTLYTSPSLPNISLGLANSSSSADTTQTGEKVVQSALSREAELRAMAAARLGQPLTGHMIPTQSGLAHLAMHGGMESELNQSFPPGNPNLLHARMKALEQQGIPPVTVQHLLAGARHGDLSGPASTVAMIATTMSTGVSRPDNQPPNAIPRRLHKPLGRTHSAPLPGTHMHHLQQQVLHPQHYMQALLRQHVVNKQQLGNGDIAKQPRPEPHPEETEEELKEHTQVTVKQEPLDSDEENEEEESCRQLDMNIDGTSTHRPLSRAQSSPATYNSVKSVFTTGVVYDPLMLKHSCSCGNNSYHPEHSGRIQSVWSRLQETGLVNRCERVRSRKATIDELKTCHSEQHVYLYGTNPLHRQKQDSKKLAGGLQKSFKYLPCGGLGVDADTIWNELHSPSALRMAAGCVIELAFKVAQGELKNGFAVVRPPGHHAEVDQAMGFCFFNSIAVTARLLVQRLKLNKVLIVDWDVHHGNGTQQMFYEDGQVLYVSLHRWDSGNFFPGTGAPDECGNGAGLGKNVNISFSGGLEPPMGDAEYMAAFRTVVMPIAVEFSPDLVLVSAGFDTAEGHAPQLGGYKVTPKCFGHMTKQLMSVAGGRVVLALEGGYDLAAICDCSEMCVQALLGDELPPLPKEIIEQPPNKNAVTSLEETIRRQTPHWSSLSRYASTVGYSLYEAYEREKEEADTVSALASLSVASAPGVGMPASANRAEAAEPMEEDGAAA
ncbi:histone deacetylase 4-like isoform X1 [Branchiostoma floridae x Branchiostoma japonicum]